MEEAITNPALVITALGHQDQFPTEWTSSAAQAVREAARRVSERLGGKLPASLDAASRAPRRA